MFDKWLKTTITCAVLIILYPLHISLISALPSLFYKILCQRDGNNKNMSFHSRNMGHTETKVKGFPYCSTFKGNVLICNLNLKERSSVLIHSGCCNSTLWNRWLINSRFIFHNFGGWEVQNWAWVSCGSSLPDS